MVPEGDADLELALSLHRQLNGLTRRSRSQPQENYKKALQSLKKRHNREGEDRQTSSGGSGKRSSKKQKTNSSSEGGRSDLTGPSSSPAGSVPSEEQQQGEGDHGSSDRKPANAAAQQQAAVAAAVAAARSKASKASNGSNGASAGDGGGGGAAAPHVKCFFAGVRWGALLPLRALKDRASLVAAVGKAFEADGARCSEASAHVVFVTADQQALEFGKPSAASELPRPEEWDAAARRAVRVYVR